jgi:hypothetical protein
MRRVLRQQTHSAEKASQAAYSVYLIFLKLFERIYAPLTAGILKPFRGDRKVAEDKRCALDRLYQRIVDDLDELLRAVGLKAA